MPAMKQATKPVTPPCIDGTRAHYVRITGEGREMSGRCIREGCTWGRPFDNTLTEKQWNSKIAKVNA